MYFQLTVFICSNTSFFMVRKQRQLIIHHSFSCCLAAVLKIARSTGFWALIPEFEIFIAEITNFLFLPLKPETSFLLRRSNVKFLLAVNTDVVYCNFIKRSATDNNFSIYIYFVLYMVTCTVNCKRVTISGPGTHIDFVKRFEVSAVMRNLFFADVGKIPNNICLIAICFNFDTEDNVISVACNICRTLFWKN